MAPVHQLHSYLISSLFKPDMLEPWRLGQDLDHEWPCKLPLLDEIGIEVAVLAVPVDVAVGLGFRVWLTTCKRARALHDKKPVIKATSLQKLPKFTATWRDAVLSPWTRCQKMSPCDNFSQGSKSSQPPNDARMACFFEHRHLAVDVVHCSLRVRGKRVTSGYFGEPPKFATKIPQLIRGSSCERTTDPGVLPACRLPVNRINRINMHKQHC